MKKILLISLMYVILACSSEKKTDDPSGHDHTTEQATQKYTCPMHPSVVQDGPGKCPVCGMDLIPMTKSSTADNTLMLNDSQLRLANITTQKISLQSVGQTIVVNGRLAIDEDRTEIISSRVAGRIEKLYARETGRLVKKGEPLYELYSESLLTLQREYLLAMEQYQTLGKEEPRYATYVKAAERKLSLYGMTQLQIEKLSKSKQVENRITYVAPAGGTIAEINVTEGQYVNEGSSLYKLENISQLWLEAELYPNEIKFIKRGDRVKVSVSGFETSPVEAVVNFMNPEYKSGTQITLIRAAVNNADLKFKPGMQAQVMFTHSARKALTLPLDAVIRDGMGAHVYVQTDVNTFAPRVVKTGIEDFDQVEITEGLMENEIIAVTGAYLLYSELILKKGINPMTAHIH
jgi:membrane fusion protein, copper/silver efflux system